MKKIFSFVMILMLIITSVLPCICATDGVTVAQVVEMLENIDTLQQMQDKRSTYKGGNYHYDITTTNTSIISAHEKARAGYEGYVAEMFAKRAQAQQAYDALSDEEKAQIDSSLTAKLSNELPTVFQTGEYSVTPRYDEYAFEAVKVGTGYAYEVSNHMISGSIPQTFILVDTSDGATTWTPSEGEYVYGESNYIVGYCCDKETGLEYGTDYKRTNLEDSGYFEANESQHIRSVISNSYPFITINEMKAELKKQGLDADFVDNLTRADIIAAVQMAVWSYANINDAAADGLEYFASIDIPRNTGIYFNPLHDYTNEVWDWLPKKRQRTFDSRAEYRVNTLAEFLCNLEAVEATADQIAISHVEVIKTKLAEHGDGTYDLTVIISVNGEILPNDDVDIIVSSYSENADGDVTTTSSQTIHAVPGQLKYKTVINTRDGDNIRVDAKGLQDLPKGVYFYDPVGGRDTSQCLVGVAEGLTYVHAENQFVFTPDMELTPIRVQEIIPEDDNVTLNVGDEAKIKITVKPEDATDTGVIFESSDENVVKVDENGNIEAVGGGEATITITPKDGSDVTKEITITVKVPVEDIIPEDDSITLNVGDEDKINITVKPEDATDTGVIYESSDETVVKVDENGNIEAVGEGEATITITSKDGSTSTTVKVTVKLPEPEYIIEVPDGINIFEGETKNLGVKVTPAEGYPTPTYTSADKSIVTVDSEGNIRGISAGATTITVDFGNGEVRVIPVVVVAPAVPLRKHHICFGKTDGIGWYEVSVNGGDFFPQGPNSTLEVYEGSILVVRVQDMWIDDEFDFYVNGKKVPLDPANTITVVVDGYMLIGALSMDTEVPDVEESINLFQQIIKIFKDFFDWFIGLFK